MSQITRGNNTLQAKRSWGQAYKTFLQSKDESFLLKIAPLILLVGSPEILVSNLIPVVGEFVDLGGFGLTAIVLLRTFVAVQKYH